MNTIFTIGHSTHAIEKFVNLLKAHQITAIADVRSQPYSRFNPQFNKEDLKKSLEEAGISYVFFGRELGARSEDANCYVDGKVQYDRLAQTPLFQSGITRILQGKEKYKIALMCAEKDPLTCHRTILVCRSLIAQGANVKHILASGTIESQDQITARLLKETSVPTVDFFQLPEDLVNQAYAIRAQQIAYEKPRVSDQYRGGR